MDTRRNNLELTRADLLGYDPDLLRCKQCGGTFCGLRVGRLFEGEPFIMCTNKDEVKEVLSAFGRRS